MRTRYAQSFGAASLLLCAGVGLRISGASLAPDQLAALRAQGATLFASTFTVKEGLGPLYNGVSCISCHSTPTVGGMGPDGIGVVIRVGKLTAAGFDPIINRGGPISRAHSIAEQGLPCDLMPGIPAGSNMTSVRNAPDLHGAGLIDAISDNDIISGANPDGKAGHGRVHRITVAGGGTRIGRFGWKADTPTLQQFVADAFRNELGITSPLAPQDHLPGERSNENHCPGESATVEDDGHIVNAVTAFIQALPPPSEQELSPQAARLFAEVGCVACHTPSLRAGKQLAWLYSDLLIHDLGPDLDDKVVQGEAGGRDWRTTPLWGVGKRPRLLHDGRAHTITEAIAAHGGDAAEARDRFSRLSQTDRDSLIKTLAAL